MARRSIPGLPAAAIILPAAVLAALALPAAAAAQASSASPLSPRPTTAVGVSQLVLDFGEGNHGSTGAVLLAGVRLPYVEAALAGEYWPNAWGVPMGTVQLQTTLYLLEDRRVLPFVVLGVGRTWSGSEITRYFVFEGPRGASASYGAGLEARLGGTYVLRTAAKLRTDGGGYNGGLEALLGYAPAPPSPIAGRDRGTGFELAVYALPLAAGSWEAVARPGYVIRFARPLGGRLRATLGFGFVHWREKLASSPGGYGYDTGAFLGLPALEWNVPRADALWLRGGPAVVMMGEGTDNGASFGATSEAILSLRRIGLPLRFGAGALWFAADEVDWLVHVALEL